MNKELTLQVKSKIWIELKDEVVFGLGRLEIFKAIEKTGSMSQAAALLGMSYRAAWGKVTATKERLQLKLVERSKGSKRGGTTLTDTGKELLRVYANFQNEAYEMMERIFADHFGNLLQHLNEPGEGANE